MAQISEITISELENWKSQKVDYQLIDVRSEEEYEALSMGGKLMPLPEIEDFVDEISRDKKVVIHCRSGKRSAMAIQLLQQRHGFDNLYNLKGGILAYEDLKNSK